MPATSRSTHDLRRRRSSGRPGSPSKSTTTKSSCATITWPRWRSRWKRDLWREIGPRAIGAVAPPGVTRALAIEGYVKAAQGVATVPADTHAFNDLLELFLIE